MQKDQPKIQMVSCCRSSNCQNSNTLAQCLWGKHMQKNQHQKQHGFLLQNQQLQNQQCTSPVPMGKVHAKRATPNPNMVPNCQKATTAKNSNALAQCPWGKRMQKESTYRAQILQTNIFETFVFSTAKWILIYCMLCMLMMQRQW